MAFQDFLASQNCSNDSEVLEMSDWFAWCLWCFDRSLGSHFTAHHTSAVNRKTIKQTCNQHLKSQTDACTMHSWNVTFFLAWWRIVTPGVSRHIILKMFKVYSKGISQGSCARVTYCTLASTTSQKTSKNKNNIPELMSTKTWKNLSSW